MPSYSDIIKNNREVSAVKWWPNFAYHFTDVMNAAGILSSGVLYSRTEAVRNNRMVNNNASTQVINITDNAVRSSVRFYFRPLTPTQYYNEGYKHKELRFDSADKDGSIGANVPIPVFLTFRLNELLNEDRIMFRNFLKPGMERSCTRAPRIFQDLILRKSTATVLLMMKHANTVMRNLSYRKDILSTEACIAYSVGMTLNAIL